MSVKPDAIACLECGSKLKTLKRHLQSEHGLTPEEYRTRWNLPSSYPMVSADYRAHRKAIATEIGLGSKGGRKKKSPTTIEGKPANPPAPAVTEGRKPKARRKLGISAG